MRINWRRRRTATLGTTAVVAAALLSVGLVPLTAVVVAAQDGAAVAHGDGSAEEQQFVARINALRASKGLPTLAVDPELSAQARIWSTTMKDAGGIFHSQDLSAGISADWQKLGENVGVGGTVDALFDAFVASPKHFENLVDPTYRYIGIGVVWDGGRMFTAHRFMGLFPTDPAPAPAPATPKRTSKTSGIPAPPQTGAPSTAPPPTSPPATEPPQELAATNATPVPPEMVAPPIDPVRLALELVELRSFAG